MNPALLSQLIALVQWGLTALGAIKEGAATNAQFIESLKLALAENRPLTTEEWAPIEALADAAHQGVQNA